MEQREVIIQRKLSQELFFPYDMAYNDSMSELWRNLGEP